MFSRRDDTDAGSRKESRHFYCTIQCVIVHYMDRSAVGLAVAIGLRVKQERQSRGWTLDQLAEAAGVSRRMVVNVEQGAVNPSVGTLLRLSDALGVGLPSLVEPPRPKPVKVTRRARARRCGAVSRRAVGVLVAGTTPPDVVELWDWTLGPGDQHSQRGPRCGHQGTGARPGGRGHRRGAETSDPRARGMPSRFPAMWRIHTPTHGDATTGSPWRCSSPASGRAPLPSEAHSWLTPPCWTRSSAGARVDAAVLALRPDYRALLLAVDGLVPGPERRCQRGAATAGRIRRPTKALREQSVDQLPHVAAWREAYRAFGAKPQRTRNSVEALMRRAETGLPRVNRLTDIYNAVSVLHQLPLGGEDLTRYTRCAAADPRHRRRTVRHDRRRCCGRRAPRAR